VTGPAIRIIAEYVEIVQRQIIPVCRLRPEIIIPMYIYLRLVPIFLEKKEGDSD